MDFNPGELEQLSEEDRHEVQRAELFVSFIRTEAWRELVSIGQVQVREREKLALMASHERKEGAPSLEYLKGTIAGIQLILGMPRISMEQAKEIEEELIERRKLRDGQSSDPW